MAADSIPRISPDVIAKRLGNSTVLVDLPSNKIFELNETGSRVWELISAGLALGDVARILGEEFDVEYGAALAETETLIARLTAEGLALR